MELMTPEAIYDDYHRLVDWWLGDNQIIGYHNDNILL